MPLSIPGSLPTSPYDALRLHTPAAAPAAEAKTPPESPPFVVQLTAAEQAYQLTLQGQTVPQIADQLYLTVATVKSYLGIPNST